jgi:radical SAM protein with 4Fe4S-binding SPASM domain
VIAVIARPLLPGEGKRRLAAEIGADAALQIYGRLLRGTLAQAEALDGVTLVLAEAPADGTYPSRSTPSPAPQRESHPLTGRDGRWQRLAQRGDGLGERLAAVFADLFAAGASAVLLVNSDSPPIPVEYLREALDRATPGTDARRDADASGAARRTHGPLVLGPAADGGYYLIGCGAPTWAQHGVALTRLLHHSPMSTPALLSFTTREARAAGVEVVHSPLWIDVDGAADLPVLARLAGAAPPRADETPRLREVYLHLTHRCARDCRHCYDKQSETADRELATAEWMAAIDQCVALGAGSFVFIGGDPLLRDDFVELIAYITGSHGARARFFFNSLIDEGFARDLADAGHGRLRALVSIDGPRAINDALRGAGDFDDAVASIAALRAAGLDPVANTVLVRPVLPGLVELAHELRAAGVGRLHLILPHQRGGAGSGDRFTTGDDATSGRELIPTGAELLDAVRALLEAAGEVGLTVDNLAAWRRRLGARNDFCAAGCRDLAIDPCGRVHACVITAGDPAFVAGSLRDQPLDDILRSSASLRLLRAARARDRAECAAGPVVDACGGECWVQAHYAARAHDEPAGYRAAFPYCDLVRPLLEELAAAALGDTVAAAACGGQAAAGSEDYALFDCI